jgi:hypothetical protein
LSNLPSDARQPSGEPNIESNRLRLFAVYPLIGGRYRRLFS